MFKPKIKIDPDLYDRLKQSAGIGGYASVDEFITHVLEKAVEELEDAASEEEVRKRLQGLGYLE